MKKYLPFYLLILLLCLLQPATAMTLKVARGNENYPPKEMRIHGNILTGLHIEIVTNTAKRLGWDVDFIEMPWSRAVLAVQAGEVDAITYIGKTAEREPNIYFLDNNILSIERTHFFVKTDNPNQIHYTGNIDDLEPYKIVIRRGFSVNAEFNNAIFLRKSLVGNMEQLIKTVIFDRAQLGVLAKDEFTHSKFYAKYHRSIKFLLPPLQEQPVYLGFSKRSQNDSLALAQTYGRALQEYRTTKEYQDLFTKYKVTIF